MFSKSDIKIIWHSIVLSWRLGLSEFQFFYGDVTSKYRSIWAISWKNFIVELLSILRTNVEYI